MVPLFSRRTISSPLLEISTSLLFRRNCFGKRTAWLFPERKTFAVAMFWSSLSCSGRRAGFWQVLLRKPRQDVYTCSIHNPRALGKQGAEAAKVTGRG